MECRLVIYSAWGKDGEATLFVLGDQLSDELRQLEPELQLVKTFAAPSWNEAARQYYEWQGWEPYKPMLDADGIEYAEDSTPDSE